MVGGQAGPLCTPCQLLRGAGVVVRWARPPVRGRDVGKAQPRTGSRLPATCP